MRQHSNHLVATAIRVALARLLAGAPRQAVLALLLAAIASSASAAHYAVCVGLNQYKTSYVPANNWLKGCVADATSLQSNLMARGEWTPENAALLLDGAATKAAIRGAITNAAAAAAPGDVFVYTHSSHGWSWTDQDGAYTVDTGLCAYDNDYADYELASDLAKFPSGAKVVVFVDACHSAGLFKAKRSARALSADAADPATVPFDLAGCVSAAIDAIRANEPARRGGDFGFTLVAENANVAGSFFLRVLAK